MPARLGTTGTVASASALGMVKVGPGLAVAADGTVGLSGTGVIASPAFYVAPGGVDTNDGSAGAPFATFGKARDAMAASSTTKVAYFRGGTYPLTTAITVSTGNGVKYLAYPGELPVFSTSTLSNLLTFSGLNDVTVQGLTFTGTTHTTDVAAVTFSNCSNVKVIANRWANCDQGVLLAGTTGSTISGNVFDTTGFCAIEAKDGANNNAIASNLITGVANTYTQGGGVYIHGCSDLTIDNNVIQGCGGAGISISNFDGPAGYQTVYTANYRVKVRYNIVRNCCLVASDSGSIYLVGRAELTTNHEVTGNLVDGFVSNQASPHVLGIYLDDEVNAVTVESNIIRGGTQSNSMQFHANKNCVFRNNIIDCSGATAGAILFQNASYAGSTQTSAAGTIGPNTVTRNIFWRSSGTLTPYVDLSGGTRTITNNLYPTGTAATTSPNVDASPQYGDPAFVDAAGLNYTLGGSSAASLIGFVPIDQTLYGLKPATASFYTLYTPPVLPAGTGLPVAQGGTGATTAKSARVAINQGLTTLTSGTTVATDASAGNVFTLTLGANGTLANPTSLASGASYAWVITQDGTGSRTLAYGTAFTWPGGTAPTLSTAAGAVDLLSAVYDGVKLRAVLNKAFG